MADLLVKFLETRAWYERNSLTNSSATLSIVGEDKLPSNAEDIVLVGVE